MKANCSVKVKGAFIEAEIIEEKVDKVKVKFASGKTDWYERKEIKRKWN